MVLRALAKGNTGVRFPYSALVPHSVLSVYCNMYYLVLRVDSNSTQHQHSVLNVYCKLLFTEELSIRLQSQHMVKAIHLYILQIHGLTVTEIVRVYTAN